MKLDGVRWERCNEFTASYAGWRLFSVPANRHLGTVFVNGSWYCTRSLGVSPSEGWNYRPGSQPLAAQALLRAAGVEP